MILILCNMQLNSNCLRITTNDKLEALTKPQKSSEIHQGIETLIAWTL